MVPGVGATQRERKRERERETGRPEEDDICSHMRRVELGLVQGPEWHLSSQLCLITRTDLPNHATVQEVRQGTRQEVFDLAKIINKH